MKLHTPTKIVFIFMVIFVALAVTFFAVNYSRIKARNASGAKTSGTCSPNTSQCQGNPELCMEMNKNLVCN